MHKISGRRFDVLMGSNGYAILRMAEVVPGRLNSGPVFKCLHHNVICVDVEPSFNPMHVRNSLAKLLGYKIVGE